MLRPVLSRAAESTIRAVHASCTWSRSGTHARGHAVPMILVIHSDAWLRSVLTDLIRRSGWIAAEASNGATGARLVFQLHPSLRLAGEQLSELRQSELVQLLASDARTRRIPVLAIGGSRVPTLGTVAPASPVDCDVADPALTLASKRGRPLAGQRPDGLQGAPQHRHPPRVVRPGRDQLIREVFHKTQPAEEAFRDAGSSTRPRHRRGGTLRRGPSVRTPGRCP
jgi:two-component system cell cycle response regulator DivK